MRTVALTGLALLLAACTAVVGTRSDDRSAPTVMATPTLPVVNVDDMMGMYPPQTVFVATADHVSAVTLLNHVIRYQIPTEGIAEVRADPGGRWLYVLDNDGIGARRLRAFDVARGEQHAELVGISDVAPGGHSLATTAGDSVLVLKANAAQAWVDAYQPAPLQLTGALLQGPACGDRLLSGGGRIAVVCSATGQVSVGTNATIGTRLEDIVAAAAGTDGSLYLVTADAHFTTIQSGTATLAPVAWPAGWSGTVVPDGMAVVQSGTQLVIAQTNTDGAWLRIITTPALSQQKSVHLAGEPHGGVVALWPFAYYAVGSSIRHVDLTSALLETMAEVGPGAAAAAVVNG